MIRLDCVQGTSAWQQARLAIPTASQFDRLITPGGKPSSQADGYMHQLLAESILGVPMDNATSGFMERGTILEKKARSFLELQRDYEVEAVGFLLRDDRRVGYSPDGLVGDDGLVEIKVPAAPTHVAYLLGAGAGEKYKPQTQGQLWIAERDWIDVLSWHPDMPSALVRQTRDEAFIAKLAAAVDQFLNVMVEMQIELQNRYGLFPDLKVPDLKVS